MAQESNNSLRSYYMEDDDIDDTIASIIAYKHIYNLMEEEKVEKSAETKYLKQLNYWKGRRKHMKEKAAELVVEGLAPTLNDAMDLYNF